MVQEMFDNRGSHSEGKPEVHSESQSSSSQSPLLTPLTLHTQTASTTEDEKNLISKAQTRRV